MFTKEIVGARLNILVNDRSRDVVTTITHCEEGRQVSGREEERMYNADLKPLITSKQK